MRIFSISPLLLAFLSAPCKAPCPESPKPQRWSSPTSSCFSSSSDTFKACADLSTTSPVMSMAFPVAHGQGPRVALRNVATAPAFVGGCSLFCQRQGKDPRGLTPWLPASVLFGPTTALASSGRLSSSFEAELKSLLQKVAHNSSFTVYFWELQWGLCRLLVSSSSSSFFLFAKLQPPSSSRSLAKPSALPQGQMWAP